MEKRIFYQLNKTSCSYEESFEVPHNVQQLTIEVKMEEACRYLMYVLLFDEKRQLRLAKLLGYGEQILGIGADGHHTSIGGVAGKIGAGSWKIAFVVFSEYVEQKIKDQEYTMEFVITDQETPLTEPFGENNWMKDGVFELDEMRYRFQEVYQSEACWYKGDFHTHTTLSDGKETVKNAMKKAQDMNLDFYVPTEHNLMHTGWRKSDLLIVPGCEITTDLGHFNLFGINKIPDGLMQMVTGSDKDTLTSCILSILKEAKEKNWLVSINHPYLSIWRWKMDQIHLSDIDCMEIVNDPTYTGAEEANQQTIRLLDQLFEDGYRICGIGGSDAHNLIEERYEGATDPSIAGDPGTYVWCEKLSAQDLLESVKEGKVCVTRFCRITPQIQWGQALLCPGAHQPAPKEDMQLTYTIHIQDMEEEPVPSLIINQKRYEMQVTPCGTGGYIASATLTLPAKELWIWCRAQITNQKGEFRGYVNPIFFGEKEHQYQSLKEVKEKVEALDDKRNLI